jgi:hypothetical protein
MAPPIARQCICVANGTRGANRNFRWDGQPAAFDVGQQIMPALCALPQADLEADHFFLALQLSRR